MQQLVAMLIFWALVTITLIFALYPPARQIRQWWTRRRAFQPLGDPSPATDAVTKDYVEVFRPGSVDEHWRTAIRDEDPR